MIKSITHIQELAKKYNIPIEDIILIALNCCGINADISEKRIRFKLKLDSCNELFYIAVCINTNKSPFFLKGDYLYLNGYKIGVIIERENDTCDSTYFRRNKTTITLNSNSRSKCSGCKFCGTYNQDAEDNNNLLTKDKLEARLRELLKENQKNDLSGTVEIGICTGCFNCENDVINHILMVRDVTKKFGFNGEIKYVGAQIFSKKIIDILTKKSSPMGISFTLECFTRREKLLKPLKTEITIPKIIDLLNYAKGKGFKVTILYILGLDSLEVFTKGFRKVLQCVNRFPIINIFQNYISEHETLRIPEAKNIEYYLKARKEMEKIFAISPLKPRLWETYRGLWYLSFKDQPLNDIRI